MNASPPRSRCTTTRFLHFASASGRVCYIYDSQGQILQPCLSGKSFSNLSSWSLFARKRMLLLQSGWDSFGVAAATGVDLVRCTPFSLSPSRSLSLSLSARCTAPIPRGAAYVTPPAFLHAASYSWHTVCYCSLGGGSEQRCRPGMLLITCVPQVSSRNRTICVPLPSGREQLVRFQRLSY